MGTQFLMKGKVYGEHKHKLHYPVRAEVKYDEIRLHVRRMHGGVEFLSYAGKSLHNLGQWAEQFDAVMCANGLEHLDVGVEVNNNFDDSYRWVRSSTGIPSNLNAGMVKFILFDLPDFGELRFQSRVNHTDRIAEAARAVGLYMWRPEFRVCASEAELDAYFIEVRERGMEGLMVKSMDHLYYSGCGKRIDGWLKMKPEDTADGRIIGINRAVSLEGQPLNRAGSVDVELEDGSTASPAGIPHSLGADMWANPGKYIGQWAEFKYMERDRQGGYRHPSLVRLREAKA